MRFDRTGCYAIGRPLRPNRRMDHFYISTVIDPGPKLHFGGEVESRLEPQSVKESLAAQWSAQCLTLETGGTQVLGSRYLRPRRWRMNQ
jgi:hypothetical protein